MIHPSNVFLEDFKRTNGAISVCESIAIMNVASEAPSGLYLDLGSHCGKAAMSASYGLSSGVFLLVDPIFDLSNVEAWSHSIQGKPENNPWGYANSPMFSTEVAMRVGRHGRNRISVATIGSYSELEIQHHSSISYCFIDSDDHGGGLPLREVKMLEDRMVLGGVIAFHDFLNQYIEPKEAYDYLISTGKYQEIPINWGEIIFYVKDNNLEYGNNSWHMPDNPYPNFVGALKKIKQ